MRIALITDLHSNREAVEAVLAHARAQGVDEWVFLGDFVGYGADPAWVIDTVADFVARGAVAVRGNHDQATAQGAAPGMREDATQVIEWTRAQLSAAQLDFLAQLPLREQRDDRLYVHANAWHPEGWEYILSRADAQRSLWATELPYTFCGHVHEPRLYHASSVGKVGDFVPTPGVAIPVPSHRRWLAIPGSVGQPRDGNPAACYALFDASEPSLTFHRVPYDVATAGAKIVAAGLPAWLAARLEEGQ